jgi:hypothetical protein
VLGYTKSLHSVPDRTVHIDTCVSTISIVCANQRILFMLLETCASTYPWPVLTAAEAADGADGRVLIGHGAHANDASARSPFPAEGNLNPKAPQECLHPTQAPGERARIRWPICPPPREVVIIGTIGREAQEV